MPSHSSASSHSSTSSTVAKLIENVRHYCRKIERHPNDSTPLLRALDVLDSLDGISIAVLSETGAGRAVNGLKKHEDEEVSAKAKALVAKWKELVQKEEEEEEEGEEDNEDAEDEDNEDASSQNSVDEAPPP